LYHATLWPRAAAQGWDPRDAEARRNVTSACMEEIGAPMTDSTTDLDEHQITALFRFLEHLADPQSLPKLSAWMSAKEDYRTFNRVRQGQHWRAQAGYKSRGKLEKRRFGNRPTAGLFDEANMTKEEADQYLLTMRKRALRKGRDGSPSRPGKRGGGIRPCQIQVALSTTAFAQPPFIRIL
jgi:hypothetical protein